MKTITVLLLCSTCVTVVLSACTTYNVSTGWYAQTCRFAFTPTYQPSWRWLDNWTHCPPGYNESATSVDPLPVNFTLQQCADGCAAHASIMDVFPMSVLWYNASWAGSGCHCYAWRLDQPAMAPTFFPQFPLTMADMTCETPPPTPAPTRAPSEVVRVSFYDSECKQPSTVNTVQLGQCAPTWPGPGSDYMIFQSCGASGARAKRFFSNDPTCNGTSEAETFPVGSCYKDTDSSNMYLVNSCVRSEPSRKLIAKLV